MSWVTWRQFRPQALAGFGVLAALAVLMLVTGLHLRDVYDSSGIAKCSAAGTCPRGVEEHFGNTYRLLRVLLGDVTIVAPALVGMFWGAPLISRELENGTFRLAWTQSVSRVRWLAVKVLIVGAAAVLVCLLYSLLFTWWVAPVQHVELNRFEPGVFDQRGIVVIGYAAFAFALGLFAGAVTRRTLLAIAVTLLAFIGVRLGLALGVREHLVTPTHKTIPAVDARVGLIATPAGVVPEAGIPPSIPNAWALSARIVDKHGHPVSESALARFVRAECPGAEEPPKPPVPGPGTTRPAPESIERCFTLLSQRYDVLVAYQPADRYWLFQGLETAIFGGLALLLIAACFWWIGRDAPRRGPAFTIARRRGAFGAPRAGAA